MRIPAPIVKCPACRAVMPNESRHKRPWTCPSCSGRFAFPLWYQNLVFWGTLGVTILLLHVLGLTGIRLYIAAAIFWIPVLLICIFCLDRIWVPRLVPCQAKAPSSEKRTGSGPRSSLDLFHH